MADPDWDGDGQSVDRAQRDYQLRSTAAFKIARSDPQMAKAARDANLARSEILSDGHLIAARQNGFKEPPPWFRMLERHERTKGKVMRINELDPLSKMLMAVQREAVDPETTHVSIVDQIKLMVEDDQELGRDIIEALKSTSR